MNIHLLFVYYISVIIWGGVSAVHRHSLEVIINKILRLILNVKYDENNVPLVPTNDMYKTLKILKFPDVYKYFLLKFIHYSLYSKPSLFQEYFVNLFPSHAYRMRISRINLPSSRLQVEKQFVIHQCCKLYNELPRDLLDPQSNSTLKNKYRDFVFSHY